jgi:hypothetical protein
MIQGIVECAYVCAPEGFPVEFCALPVELGPEGILAVTFLLCLS